MNSNSNKADYSHIIAMLIGVGTNIPTVIGSINMVIWMLERKPGWMMTICMFFNVV